MFQKHVYIFYKRKKKEQLRQYETCSFLRGSFILLLFRISMWLPRVIHRSSYLHSLNKNVFHYRSIRSYRSLARLLKNLNQRDLRVIVLHRLSMLVCSFLFLERERSEEHTSELQSRGHLVCRLLLEKNNTTT